MQIEKLMRHLIVFSLFLGIVLAHMLATVNTLLIVSCDTRYNINIILYALLMIVLRTLYLKVKSFSH